MKESLLFNKDITYDEYLKTVQDCLIKKNSFLASSEMIQKGVDSMVQIDDLDKRNKVLSSSMLADKQLSDYYSRNKNITRKIPTILTICHLVNDYYDDVKDLNDKQLVLCSFLNSFIEPEALSSNLMFSSNKKLLSAIIKKTSDIMEQMNILAVVEKQFSNANIDKSDKNSVNNFVVESTSFVENNTREELLSRVPTSQEIFEIMSKHNIYF